MNKKIIFACLRSLVLLIAIAVTLMNPDLIGRTGAGMVLIEDSIEVYRVENGALVPVEIGADTYSISIDNNEITAETATTGFNRGNLIIVKLDEDTCAPLEATFELYCLINNEERIVKGSSFNTVNGSYIYENLSYRAYYLREIEAEKSYQFIVENTGNVTLTGLTVADGFLGISKLALSPSTLAPGESGSVIALYQITQEDLDAGSVTTSAAVNALDPQNNTVTNVDDEKVDGPDPRPSLSLSKTASSETYSKANDVIVYTFIVENTGNVTLRHVKIDDPLTESSGLEVSPSTLISGQTGTITAEYIITQADLDRGECSQ